ncbi:MAG: hypothetical protein G8D28_03040 [gamma proteobacterium symbiont of Phacoides pectinatus]
MLSDNELRKRLQRHWDSGRILRAWAGQDPELFPLSISAGRPDARRLVEAFSTVRSWKDALERESSSGGYRIDYREINHRSLGRQRLPAHLVFDTPEQVIEYLGKGRELKRFQQASDLITTRQPRLHAWLHEHPLKLLEHAGHWEQLLAVIDYFQAHPRPGRYLRELLIPSVDTKFIETHMGLLGQLLDQVLPDTAIDQQVTGLARHGFERRFGLRYDQPLIRFRLLDAAAAAAYGGLDDITLPLERFRTLAPWIRRVFITENKINGLSFPSLSDSMVIFGLGYGVGALRSIDWLQGCEIHYWGDIDTHGFAMLSQLRADYPGTRSLLMDRHTLEAFPEAWVEEKGRRQLAELENLNREERRCYRLLCEDALGQSLRLEQERLPYEWIVRAIRGLK